MDIVARLKEEAVDYEWDGIDGSLSEWPLLIEAADEITHLRARLEVREDGGPDGIECRDQTIRMLDQEITRLRAEVGALRKCCAQRGARMQKMFYWINSTGTFVEMPHEFINWFDADGVPVEDAALRDEGE